MSPSSSFFFLSSRTTVTVTLASASAVWVTWRLVRWRARTRARESVHRVQNMIKDGGPLIDYGNDVVRERILSGAIHRASKWMSLSEDTFRPMVGQVGGKSSEKKQLLTMQPDYVLKPLRADHRGIREIAFYEAVKIIAASPTNRTYAAFLTGKEIAAAAGSGVGRGVVAVDAGGRGMMPSSSSTSSSVVGGGGGRSLQTTVRNLLEVFDTIALAAAMFARDPVVLQSEQDVRTCWRRVKREVDTLHLMTKFTSSYYGVLGQRSVSACPDTPFGVSNDSFLLLTDLTASFSKPCVMDLKMGTKTYEPAAPREKLLRERAKYAQQESFGFRIVGARLYDPDHPDSDPVTGYLSMDKHKGRSLHTEADVKQTLRVFFGAGVENKKKRKEQPSGGAGAGPTTSSSSSADNNNDGNNNNSNNNNVEKRTERVRMRAMSNLLVQLRPVRRFFEETNTSLVFCASSLLIIYEGDTASEQQLGNEDIASVTMIDFGRVRRSAGGDPGYCHGLTTLKHMITDILTEEEEWLRGEEHTATTSSVAAAAATGDQQQ